MCKKTEGSVNSFIYEQEKYNYLDIERQTRCVIACQNQVKY